MKIFFSLMLTTVLLLFTSFPGANVVYAQRGSGEISGVVKDKSTNETLPYALVNLKGTSVQTLTDVDGVFRLLNLDAGEHTLIVVFVGYASHEENVTLGAGEKTNIEILLSEPLISLGEVMVTAQRMGQNAAINQRLNSDALVNVVSKDAIRELPDINAAEAIGRLPGTSITRSGGEGSKVILRGLDPKFASVTINGVRQPATDADRSVDLSNISPEMLSGIEVFKSPTADMDGDAIGGSVNLVVAKAPDRPRNQFRVYGGYNGLSRTLSDYKGSWDFAKRFFDKKLGMMLQANYDQRNRGANGFSRSYHVPDSYNPEDFYISGVTMTLREQTTKRYATSAFFDLQLKNAGFWFNNIYNASPRHNYSHTESISRGSFSVGHGVSLSEGDTRSLNSSLGGNWNLSFMKMDWSLTRVHTNSYNPFDYSLSFSSDKPALNQDVNYDRITDPQVYLDNVLFNSSVMDTVSSLRSGSFTPDTMKQVSYVAKLDFEVPFKIGAKIAGLFKFGGKYQSESRNHSGQNFIPWPFDISVQQAQIIHRNDPRDLTHNDAWLPYMNNFYDPRGSDLMHGKYHMYSYIPEKEIRYWIDHHFSSVGARYEEEYTNNQEGIEGRIYETTERVTAAYMMLKLNYGNFLTFVPGFRYEYSNNDYTGIFSTLANFPAQTGFYNYRNAHRTYGEFLPSIHLKVKPISWMDIRLSTVKTLNRPNYNWIVPRLRYNANSYSVSKGNPDLKHATAWNYDASITIYTGEFGLMSFGGYMKNIKNMYYSVSGTLSIQESLNLGLPGVQFELGGDYRNFDDSYVKGLEFEYNTHFNFLPAPFNRFILGFNLTRLWSGTYYLSWQRINGLELVRERPVLGVDFNRSFYKKMEDRMPTQVDWTSNTWLGFEHKAFSTRVSFAYQGSRLSGINIEQDSEAYNSYTASSFRIDFTSKYKISNMVSVMLNMNNLTNYQDGGYRWKPEFPTSRTMYGMTGELGVQINLW